MNLSKEKYEKIDNLVKAVSAKYTSKLLKFDENYSSLWYHLITKSGDHLEDMDMALIAKNCWNKMVDIYRREKRARRKEFTAADCNFPDILDIKEFLGEGNNQFYYNNELDNILNDNLLIRGILDLFESDSKERKYLIILLMNIGAIKDTSILTEEEVEFYNSSNNTSVCDKYILASIGYNTTKTNRPASWGAKKYLIKEKIKNYLKEFHKNEQK